MALTDEINQNTQNTSGAQQGSTTPSRPSLLQELVSTQGTEGKNVGYINYALANGGGFGATAAGVVKDESGNLNPIYDFNRSDEEIAYAKARKRGENIDTWYSRAESESTAASERYETLKTQLDELNKSRNRALTASPTAFAVYKNAASQDEISHLVKALEQAQKAVERTSAEFSAAKAYRDYRDTTRPVEEAAERGVSYSDQYEAYSQSIDKLNKQKEELNKQLKAAKNGSGYFGAAATYEQDKARQEEDVKSISEKLEEITRQIARIEGNRNYAERYLTNDADAKQMIQRGLEEEGRLLAEQMEAGRRVLGESDPDAGIATYTKYRGATREGVHVREDWPQEAKDQYYYRLGKYGQQAAEEYATRVNSELNQNAMQQATAGARAFGAQENGNKLQKAGAGVLGLGASLTTPLFHAMSYIDKLSAAASGTPYTGRDFALPSDQVNAMVRGRAEQLNKDYGTIDSSTPILGGKGWGDIYQLGQSVVQSLALGNTVGEVGTLAAFFAQSADNAFDEAKARGGNDQYAAMYSVLSGFAEVAGEKISLDHLLKGGKIGSLSYLLKQAGIEGAEEVNTSVLNSFFDRVAADLTGNQTAIEQKIDSLVRQGMSYEEAEKQVWKETVEDVAWDFVGGFVSGFASGGVETAIRGTRNQLWEMRKDSVLGRQNAEGQREGGNKNVSNQELRSMFNRALERGDITAAEQIARALEAQSGQVEEQEYGPADPRANEKMQNRLARQLNGERINPQTENADYVAESAVNRQLAEDARIQAEFPTLSPITMHNIKHLNGRNFVIAAKSMTTQQLAEAARYAEFIGENEKAAILKEIRENPGYQYQRPREEERPFPTDADEPIRHMYQNAAGQQEAPGGQITQPSQQNAAQTVKPGDYEQTGGTTTTATAEPLTTSTESGTIEQGTKEKTNPNELAQQLYERLLATYRNGGSGQDILKAQSDFFALADEQGLKSYEYNNLFKSAISEAFLDYNKERTGQGLFSDFYKKMTQEVNNNAGEQALRTDEAEEAADFGVGRRPAGAGAATSQLGASENAQETVEREKGGNVQSLPRFVTQEDLNELSDVEESAPISDEQKAEYSKFDNLLNSGTQVVNKPQIGSRLHLAWSLAKKLGLKTLFARNYNGSVFKDGSTAYQNGGDAIIDADSTQMELATAVAHEAGHGHYFAKFGAFTNILNGAYTKRLNFFTGVFNDAFGMMKGLQTMRDVEKYIREDRGYQAKYDRSHARYLREVNAMITNHLAQNATKLVAEMEKARAVEEFMNQILAWDTWFIDSFSGKTEMSYDEISLLRGKLVDALIDNGIFTAEEIAAIDDSIHTLKEGGFTDDLSDEEEFGDFEAVDTDADAADFKGDLNRSIRRAASGDTSYMKNTELLAVLNYALDRAAPTSKGQPLSERLSDLYNEYGNSATSYVSEAGDYFGRHVGNLSEGKTDNLMRTVDTVLRELERRGYNFDRVNSSATDYENKFGIVFENKKAEQFDRGNGRIGVSKRKNVQLDLSQEAKAETDNARETDWKSEAETEADYDRRNMKRDLDALRNGTNYVKEAVQTKPEDHGWIKPVEVSAKEVKRARDAVEAKGKEAELKDRIKTLEAQKDYLTAVANAMQKARSDFYNSGDIEQRKADLGYIADSLNEQLEQLDADLGYVAEGIIGTEEEAAMDSILAQKERANAQLNALRDEYKHIDDNDSAALRNVRTQIDSVVSEIAALSRQLDGVSKRAERADWGSNKRTLFQAEMAENPDGLLQERSLPEQNREEPLSATGWPQPAVNRASGKTFMSEFDTEPVRRTMSEDPIVHMSTKELDDYLKRMRSVDDEFNAADFGEPARGMGTGYRGMQTSRNKDGSLEFRTMYDDALPTRPATDKSRQALKAPSTAYGNVAQAARSILNSKDSFLDFSKDRPKDIPSKVTNAMGQLHEHVREMMEGYHPVNALMQISNMIREFENDDDLKVFSSDDIQKAVAELNDIYYNQDITNEEKAKRMVENATKTLSLISKRVQLVDRGYHMLKSFVGPRKKRDNTDFWSKYKAMQLNPSTLFKAMDGFARDKNGSGYQIAKMIENGTALYMITQAQALQKLSAISGMEGFKEFSEGNTKPFDIDGVKITEQQAVEFIMQVRNLLATEVTGKDGPTNRLNTIGGFSIRDKDGKSTFIERSNDPDVTNAEWYSTLADSFEKSLSPAAKKYLEAATEILDELGQQANDIRMNLIGTGFDGSINGTYYPITYDNKNGSSKNQQPQNAGLLSGPMYQSRTRNFGGYVNIKNASDTLDKYIHWASNAIGYGEVAELLRAMDNTGGRMQSLSGLADDMLGQGYSKYIEKYVNDVNEVPDGHKDNDSIWAKLRRNMASGALLGNLGVAAKQAASLWSAAGVLSPQALLSAETYFGGHSGAGNMLLQSRKTGTSLDPTISEILHNDSFMGKLMKRTRVSEFMGKATALVDYQTVKRLFAATVVDTKLSFPGLDQNSELFAQAVEAKFQDVVLQTQPIFVKNARAGYLRANDELTKAFAMFRTQPTQNLNAIVTAIGEYNALKGTELGKAAGKKLRNTIIGQTASAVTFAVLSSLVGFARHGWKKFRDDDDELSWLEVAKRIGLDSVESLAGLTVVGGDIAKAIITMATGGEEKEFYDMNTGVLSMLGDTLSSVTTFGTNVFKAIQEGKPLAVFNAGRQAADNVLQVGLGIPANTVYRLLNTITMYSADALYALSDGKLGNRANYDDAMKMLDAYIKGNLTEEGAKKQADKAFRKGQPENLLYNLGILSSLSNPDGKTKDKGRTWLDSKLKKSGDSEEGASSNQRILDYLVKQALSAEQLDKAVGSYVTAGDYDQTYSAVRATGASPKEAIETIASVDADGNGSTTQNELWDYYKANQKKDKQVGAIWDSKGYTKDGQPRPWDSYKDEQERKEFKAVVDANGNNRLTQAELLEYYKAHPDEEDKIAELWEANGWKTSWSSYKAKNAS